MSAQKFIVIPYKKAKGRLSTGEIRQATTAVSAEKIAGSMAARFIGVAAYEVTVDEESGDMTAPRLIISHGEIAELAAA